MIPRVIHQIWLGESGGPHPPQRFLENAQSWKDHHPDWEYRLWSAEAVEALIAKERPELLPLYHGYPHWVQRADAARYLILLLMGGVYADLDIRCTRRLDPLLEHDVVLSPTEPMGVSNDLMMAAAGTPLFTELVNDLPAALARWGRPWIPRHFQIMCGTGSLFVTRGLRRHGSVSGLRLLTGGEYGGGSPSEALVRHEEGNTWAGWDTHALLFAGRHWKVMTPLVLLGLIASVAAALNP